MDRYPLALYRPGSEFEWEGRKLDILAVGDATDEALALEQGWQTAEQVLAGPEMVDLADPAISPVPSDEAIAEAVRHPLDHDGDGKPGGSLPGRRKRRA